MAFPNTPGVPAAYNDGALKLQTLSTQPEILILAPATSGRTDEIFPVANSGAAEAEFGSDTDLCRAMHEVIGQNADHISLMRVGGRGGSIVFTDSTSGTLTITPLDRDNEILSQYTLIIETVSGGFNRYLVYDLVNDQWVYDSLEILTINGELIDVDDSSFDLFTIGDITDPTSGIALSDLVTGDFIAAGSSTLTSIDINEGDDGTNVSLVEKYAALNRAYHTLDFRDMDFLIAKGVYIDDQNVADDDVCNFFKGVPVPGDTNDTLGYVWQMEYQGSLYTYFVDTADYFTAAKAAATVTINTNVVYTAAKTGTGGNNISVQHTITSGAVTVTVTEPAYNSLHVLTVGAGTVTTAQIVSAVNTALGAYTMANGQLASTILTASGGSGAFIATVASTPLASGTGGHVLTHADLTGDTIPSAVSTAFAAAESANSDEQLRECNFAHQLASYCYMASTTWKDVLGAISVKEPPGFSRSDIASWVGTPPDISDIGLDKAIDAPADNGSGLFAIKLLAGKSASNNGYRSLLVDAGDSTDSYLFGGLIKTKGLSLPNADTDLAYGIDDGDEDEDANGKPIDIGKHIFVTTDWPVHSNSFNNGAFYRGSIEASFLALLATMPANQEPIGRDFVLRRIRGVPRIHASQRDALNKFRFVNLRFEQGVGWIFNSCRTAAHPLDSDYSRLSTIRCANKILAGIRNIAKNYIGKPFDAYRLTAMKTDIDGFLVAQKRDGFTQGAVALVQWTRNDRILGKLTIPVKMVPPFTIQEITEVLSIAGDESEL